MMTIILFILIGIKLDMLNGWYLALIILKIVFQLIDFGFKCLKVGMGE